MSDNRHHLERYKDERRILSELNDNCNNSNTIFSSSIKHKEEEENIEEDKFAEFKSNFKSRYDKPRYQWTEQDWTDHWNSHSRFRQFYYNVMGMPLTDKMILYFWIAMIIVTLLSFVLT
ncbi:hypothetical protein MHH70_17235 [Metasolibacillus sp. FSL H7-0170]|uniref:hypothetical protein n=1 Tax=Metasolibacillus sp. FSL H7-0170 TaxID=2921431 RepID=UPI00315965FC